MRIDYDDKEEGDAAFERELAGLPVVESVTGVMMTGVLMPGDEPFLPVCRAPGFDIPEGIAPGTDADFAWASFREWGKKADGPERLIVAKARLEIAWPHLGVERRVVIDLFHSTRRLFNMLVLSKGNFGITAAERGTLPEPLLKLQAPMDDETLHELVDIAATIEAAQEAERQS